MQEMSGPEEITNTKDNLCVLGERWVMGGAVKLFLRQAAPGIGYFLILFV